MCSPISKPPLTLLLPSQSLSKISSQNDSLLEQQRQIITSSVLATKVI